MIFEKHIDDEIKTIEENLRKLKQYKSELVENIKQHVLVQKEGEPLLPSQKLRAALHYGLEIVPRGPITPFPFEMLGTVGVAKIKDSIGNEEGSTKIWPTYVGTVRDMIEGPIDWMDMWKEYVEKDKTKMSYVEFIEDIKQHRDEALKALLEQHYGELLIPVDYKPLKLNNIIILVPKVAQIFPRELD